MRKTIKMIFSIWAFFIVGCTFMTRAEAAWVAAVPIEVDDTKVERAKDFNDYYWDIIVNRFQYPTYELMDDEKVVEAVPEKGLPSFDRSVLAGVAEQIDADIVIAMRIDSVEEIPGSMFAAEPMVECRMDGEFASYNRLTEKYYHNKIQQVNMIEEALLLRNDWQYRIFNSELNRHINRTLEDKDIKKTEKKTKNTKSDRQEEKK